MLSQEIEVLARTIACYLRRDDPPEKADCILGLGCSDKRIAHRCADLFFEGWAARIVFAGAKGNQTKHWDKTEAETFKKIAVERGVPKDTIYTETQSRNTGENFSFTGRLLAERGLDLQKFIVVHKPYMTRRAFATGKVHWPAKDLVMTSPQIRFEEYPTPGVSMEKVINIMVGYLQRIIIYPQKGYQIRQAVWPDVMAAYERLIELGYTENLIS
jgi:uncharacterized SAM-binding protein YcdF (DUF218 family)